MHLELLFLTRNLETPDLRRAIRFLETTPARVFHEKLGQLAAGFEDTEGAVGHFREALRLEPGRPYSAAELGMLLVRAGRHDEALELLETAWRGGVRLTNVLWYLAELRRRGGNTAGALALYAAIEGRPDAPPQLSQRLQELRQP